MTARLVERFTLCGSLPPFELTPSERGIAPDRSVRIAELSAEKKRRLWAWLQANEPGVAATLQCPEARALLAGFPGASPVLDIDLVRRALA